MFIREKGVRAKGLCLFEGLMLKWSVVLLFSGKQREDFVVIWFYSHWQRFLLDRRGFVTDSVFEDMSQTPAPSFITIKWSHGVLSGYRWSPYYLIWCRKSLTNWNSFAHFIWMTVLALFPKAASLTHYWFFTIRFKRKCFLCLNPSFITKKLSDGSSLTALIQ